MSISDTTRIIQLILAPAVMVSACAILISGMMSQYGAINDRLRALACERLQLLWAPDGGFRAVEQPTHEFVAERLGQIDTQVPHLLFRHNLVHRALFVTYFAILGYLGSMFAIAIAATVGAPSTHVSPAATVALLVFLASTAALLVGATEMVRNIGVSQRTVQYEARRVLELGK